MNELTQEIVRELLDYDPETGVLTWRERDLKWFKSGKNYSENLRIANSWNTKWAGKQAFTTIDNGYNIGFLLFKKVKAHRVIWLYVHGYMPIYTDHVNGLRDDNRLVNLRAVTPSTNSKNTAMRKTNTSGYPGVQRLRGCKTYGLQITLLNGERYAENGFVDAEAAFDRWKALASENDYHENHCKEGRSRY